MRIATEMMMFIRLKMIFGGMLATNEIIVNELTPINWEIIAQGEKYYAVREDNDVYIYFVDGESEIEVMSFCY